MQLTIPSMFDSWGGPLTPSSIPVLSLFDQDQNGEGASASDIAVALGLASIGGAVAAAALGNFVVLREKGEARLPWEEKKLKIHSPLTPSDWSRAFDESTGRLKGGGQKAVGRVRIGGCSNSIRGEVWPLLLGLHEIGSTTREREEERRKRREKFVELRHLAKVITRRAEKLEEMRVKEEERARTGASERRERERERKEEERSERERRERDRKREWEGQGEVSEQRDAHGREKKEKEILGEEGVLVEKRESGEESKEEGEQEEVFSDAVEVSSASGLEASTESFIDVSHEDSAETPLLSDSSTLSTEQGESGRGSREARGTSPAVDTQKGDSSGDSSSDDEHDSAESEWEQLSSSIPVAYRTSPRGGGSGSLQDFLVWRRIMRLDAVRMNSQWVPYSTQTDFPEDEANEAVEEAEVKNYEHLSAAQRTHAARLVSILEAYAVLDPEIGYCQGMTDLLSPFVALILDDSDAFWCFVRFMETARHNFRTDEVGIRKQLDLVARILEICDPELYRHLSDLEAQDCIFVYRMVIVLLRRELSFGQTVSLWEVLWAEAAAAAFADSAAAAAAAIGATMSSGRDYPYALSPARTDFFLFVVAAIIVSRREQVLKCQGLDEVLRLCNSLAGKLDVWEMVNEARSLVCLYGLLEGSD